MLLYPHVIFSVCLSIYIGKRISKDYLLSGVGFIHLGVAYSRVHVAEICIDLHIFPCLYRNRCLEGSLSTLRARIGDLLTRFQHAFVSSMVRGLWSRRRVSQSERLLQLGVRLFLSEVQVYQIQTLHPKSWRDRRPEIRR